jgi:Recombination endonuclease VII
MPSGMSETNRGSRHHFGKRTACSQGHPYVEGSWKFVVKDGRQYRHCRVCSRLVSAKSHQKYYYGITQAERDAIFVAQGSRCAVCKSSEHGGRGWHTDHDHETKQVRGILCHPCNLALGNVKDQVEILQALIEYLARGTGAESQPRNTDALSETSHVEFPQEDLAVHPRPTLAADSFGCGF